MPAKPKKRARLARPWTVALLAAALAALALADAAAADKEKIHLTAEGQAAARAAVLKRADLGAATGWKGGARKPDLSSTPPCESFRPKQSDLVLNGAAETRWTHPGVQIDTEAQVLQTAQMVRLDWQRTVLSPKVLPCLREAIAKSLDAKTHLVSLRHLAFPRVATYTRAYRALMDVDAPTGSVRVLSDVVVVGRGRTELTLTTTAPFAAEALVRQSELRLARLLASRIRA
jgi:hypothetical protein